MIITVDPDRGFHDRVLAAVAGTSWAQHALHVGDPAQVVDVVGVGAIPAVVVVGRNVALPAATALAHRLTQADVPVGVILVTEPTNDVLRSALRAGARDVLPPSFDDSELRSAIDRTGLADATEVLGPGLTVAVFSTKGGVGTSTIAANLASRLGDRVGVEAALLDLDVASADQSIMHGLTPTWTLQELVDGSIGTDGESLRQVLRPVDGGTASILPGPLDPALAETIAGDAVARVIAASRTVAPIVVLDTASSFDDRTLAAIDAADAIVVVSSLDVAALRALTVTLQTFDRIGIDPGTVRVALVRADSKSGLQVADVERSIGRPVDGRLPSSRAVVRSLNEGVPLAVSAPRSSYVKAIDELVESVLELGSEELRRAAEEGSSSSWFPFGRGRGSDTATTGVEPSTTREVQPSPTRDVASSSTTGVRSHSPSDVGSAPTSDVGSAATGDLGSAATNDVGSTTEVEELTPATPSSDRQGDARRPTHPSVPPPARPTRPQVVAPGEPPTGGPPVGDDAVADRREGASVAEFRRPVAEFDDNRPVGDTRDEDPRDEAERRAGDVATAVDEDGSEDGRPTADDRSVEVGRNRRGLGADSDREAETDPAVRLAVALDALPPPRTSSDDEDDDQPRRRFGLRR